MHTAARFALVCALAASAFAQTPAATQSSVPTAWPTAHFASTKDPSVQKALQILNDMIKALGGDAYLNVRDTKTEGRAYAFYHGQPSGQGLVFWRFWEWPDKERVELTKQRDVIELNVGDKGYEITYKGSDLGQPSGQGLVFWRFWEWPDKERVELTKQRDVIELNVGDKGYEITYKGT